MAEVTVTTGAELETAITNSDTPIHLNAALFTLTQDSTIDYDCVIDVLPAWDSGDITIDGNDTYQIYVTPTAAHTLEITGDSDAQIIFTQGEPHNLQLNCNTAELTAVITYCTFSQAKNSSSIFGNGVNMVSNNQYGRAEFFNCQFISNDQDGLNLSSTGTGDMLLAICVNCTFNNNGDGGSDGGRGDGATCHQENNVLILYNCTFTDNFKNGVAMAAGSVYIHECIFSGNNSGAGSGQVYCVGNAYADIQKCIFTLTREGAGYSVTSQNDIYIGATCAGAYIKGNIFKNKATHTGKVMCIGVYSTATIENNIFYDFYGGIVVDGDDATAIIRSNIFLNGDQSANFDSAVLHCAGTYLPYNKNPLCGYNIFYDNDRNFRDNGTTQLCSAQPTDLVDVDPKCADVANGDFSLLPTSPCLNTGITTVNNGFTSIGAWQRKQYPMRIKMDGLI